MTRDNTFLEPTFKGTHVSITNTLHNAKREQCLPVSLRHRPSWPSATTCGHHRWDWALPHGSRKQRTHSTELYSITVTNSVRIKSAFYAPPGAHQSSAPDTPPQRLRARGRCQRSWQSSSSISRACCSSSNPSAQETTRDFPAARRPTVRLSSLPPLAPPP